MKYKVIKSIYRLSEKKRYNVGEIVEMSEKDAEPILDRGWIEKVKAKRNKKSPIIDELKTK